jgi:hypothetical protein
MYQLAVVGAGAAGLAAARALAQRGIHPVIFEKSRGPGGRAATRRVRGCIIDHGAQVVQSPGDMLRQLVLADPPAGYAAAQAIDRPVWVFDAAGNSTPGDPAHNAEPRWCWPDGVHTLGKILANGLNVCTGVRIQRLVATTDGYHLYNETGQHVGSARAVLLTPPGPQTAELLAASILDQQTQALLLQELQQSAYRRSLSVALAYASRPDVPWYAMVNLDRQHAVAWLACEHAKPGHAPDGIGLMIAQMSDEFSAAHWDSVPKGTRSTAEVQASPALWQAHTAVQDLAGDLGGPLWADVHRWRYALPEQGADFDVLNSTGSGLYFAGDYVNGRGRVHEAIERGWQVAERIGTALANG